MGKAFWDRFPEAREIFARADEAAGLDLSRICFEGPEERLAATDICQPAILTTSLAIVRVLERRRALRPEQFRAAAGLSLGEYTALCFAGVFELEDAVRLVRSRGLFMQEASKRHPSGMLALIGAHREDAEAIVAEASETGVIVAANFLAPGQIALSGSHAAIDAAERAALAHGIRRAVRLKVAGAFHSPLMESAAARLQEQLESISFEPPRVPVISNVTANVVASPDHARTLLSRQLLSPVLWEDTMSRFVTMGIESFVEPGPGRVLSGLARKCVPGATSQNIDSPDQIESYLPDAGDGTVTGNGNRGRPGQHDGEAGQ
jgi:[acyl-carrier-protein] S-malonyltransferase